MTTGKAYLDTRQALEDLGLSEERCKTLGIRLYKVGVTWPLEPEGARRFAEGLQEVIVIEEKRSNLEDQLVRILYNAPADRRPLVIGKTARRVSKDHAFDIVAGITMCDEGTIRDWIRHGRFNVTQGKCWDATGSIGPWIVTADELDPRGPHDIVTRVNGEVRQSSNTRHLVFNTFDQLAEVSQALTLEPGDVIYTGTPEGVAAVVAGDTLTGGVGGLTGISVTVQAA